MHLRFIVQPAMATLLAIRAGVQDARAGALPFLAALRHREERREQLHRAWKQVRAVFFVAVALDAVYQVRVHRAIYTLELLLTAVALALVPYCLVRDPAARIARAYRAAMGRGPQRAA
jgi:hypothetical protein